MTHILGVEQVAAMPGRVRQAQQQLVIAAGGLGGDHGTGWQAAQPGQHTGTRVGQFDRVGLTVLVDQQLGAGDIDADKAGVGGKGLFHDAQWSRRGGTTLGRELVHIGAPLAPSRT
jgi:hypothetical protein